MSETANRPTVDAGGSDGHAPTRSINPNYSNNPNKPDNPNNPIRTTFNPSTFHTDQPHASMPQRSNP